VAWGRAEISGEAPERVAERDIERGADLSAPSVGVKGVDVFILGDGDGLEHGVGEIGECTGDFGLNLPLGDSAKEARHGNAEIASGQQFVGRKREMSSPTCWEARDAASFWAWK